MARERGTSGLLYRWMVSIYHESYFPNMLRSSFIRLVLVFGPWRLADGTESVAVKGRSEQQEAQFTEPKKKYKFSEYDSLKRDFLFYIPFE